MLGRLGEFGPSQRSVFEGDGATFKAKAVSDQVRLPEMPCTEPGADTFEVLSRCPLLLPYDFGVSKGMEPRGNAFKVQS